jgi:hypothetical protein
MGDINTKGDPKISPGVSQLLTGKRVKAGHGREREMDVMQKKIQRYNVEQLGSIPTEREDGTMRILVCQMGGCASVKMREITISATERLIRNLTRGDS